ncbi:MAG: FtsX-like permease family protein [Proteobacteria bacterium]|nr:FtsX-like permease family protein [Pseudomonadota bacterium]
MGTRTRAISRTWKNFKRHPLLHLASISTISASCIILGGFLLCSRNFQNIAEKTNPNITGTAYLRENLSDYQVSQLKDRLLAQNHIMKVSFKPKKKVADELQIFLGSSAGEVLPGSELFPDIMELELHKDTSTGDIAALTKLLSREPEITEVDFSEDWLAQYKKVRGLISGLGWVLMLALVLGCSFIIANFMGMRHQSRKEEIEIVQLIGAERSFVLTPFVWEGVIEGLLGAGLAMGILLFGKWLLGDLIANEWTAVLGTSSWLFLSIEQMLLLAFIGMATALLGSFTVFFKTAERFR